MDKHERYRQLHPERVKASHATHYHRHRDSICEHRRQQYVEQREEVLKRMRQRATCPICSKELTKRYIHAHVLRRHGSAKR